MVEPAFGLLRTRIDDLLVRAQAPPARSTGAELFEANPKSLTGSLLRIKEDSAVDGIGGFATVKQHLDLRNESGQPELKVSVTGSGAGADCAAEAALMDLAS